jgi:tripartite-type tricarboxylate transporter receptor subunit TctC
MQLPNRRQFFHVAASAALLHAASRSVSAQVYPSRLLRLIVGVTAGGANDTVARLLAQWLTERLGQQVVVENRPGAGGLVAAEAVANAAADGHTLLFVTSANAIGVGSNDKTSFNFARDIAPIATLVRGPLIMEVNPAFSARTVPEFIAYAKANPGKITFASTSTGSTQHLAGELFKMMTGVNMVHVPYRGASPALTDLISGQVHVMFGPLPPSIEFIRSGKLRALAVTTQTRSQALPDVPTVAEFVPGYEASGWNGVGAPKNTPAEIIDKLNREINAALADPDIKARLADLGGTALAGSAAEFGTLVTEETEKWAKVVRFSGAKAE